MIKLAFFDVDGTLSAPRFQETDGEFVIGFSQEKWEEYCRKEKEKAYRHCLPVSEIGKFAESLFRQGTRIFVLTASASEQETEAKRVFVRENYPGIFEDLIATKNDQEKINVIRRMARDSGTSLEECMLVEDTFPTLLSAHVEGIRAVHMSNIIAGNVSR